MHPYDKAEEFWAVRSGNRFWVRGGGTQAFSHRASLRNVVHFYSEDQVIHTIQGRINDGRKFISHYPEFANIKDASEIKDIYLRKRMENYLHWFDARPVKILIAVVS